MENQIIKDVDFTEIKKDEEPDLLKILEQKTATKAPGKEPGKTFWDKLDEGAAANDFKEPKEAPKTPADDNNPTGAKISKEQKENSAKVAIGMLCMLNDLVTQPILNHKFKSKFDEIETDRLESLIDKNNADLSGEDLELKNKFDRLIAKHNKKLAAVEVKPDEKKQLAAALETYFEIKNQTLSPEWFLAFAALTFVGQRAIDLSFD